MKFKIKFLLAFQFMVVVLFASDGSNANLLGNPGFEKGDGGLPLKWHGLGGERAKAYTTHDGVVEISNITGAYANYLSQSVPIDERKTYYFEAEVLSDALSGHASVVYSVIDGNNRKIVADQPILRKIQGPFDKWSKFSAVVPIPVDRGAKRLSVGFILYNPSRRSGVSDRVAFRKPLLCEYSGQKVIVPSVSKSKTAARLPDNPFPGNFTGEPIGSIYSLERHGVGFLRLNSGVMPKAPVDMSVDIPQGVDCELYLSYAGRTTLSKISPVEKGRYNLGKNISWVTWGNSLLFRANDNAPQAFDIVINISSCGRTVSHKVPVRVFEPATGKVLPKERRFNSWQAFPVMRMDTENPSNRLAQALADYWRKAGWRHTPFVEVDGAFPARIKPATRSLAEGAQRLADMAVDAKGAPINAWCDTDWLSRDTEHFVARLKKSGIGKRLLSAQYAMWDFEPYNEGPVTIGCFCDRCRSEFARSISLEKVPGGIEILSGYKAQWIRFRCWQRSKVVHSAVKAIKALNPSIRFILCTMPDDPGTDPDWMLKYGIDLSLYADFVDIYATMNYSQGLDFFRSLESECRNLKKETRMFISNGWGRQNEPRRAAMQLLASFFAGVDYPFIGQGLYVSQCNQIAAFRDAMDFVARTESRWSPGEVVVDGKLKVTPGFRSENTIYSLERRTGDGVRHVIVFNNSESEKAFARVSGFGDEELNVAVPPLSWKYVELSAGKIEGLRRESRAAAAEAKAAEKNYEKMFRTRRINGISTSSTPDVFTVETPAQSVEFNLRNNAIGRWSVAGRTRGEMLGRDYFTLDGMFAEPKKGEGTVESSNISKDRAEVTVAYKIADAPYDGLVVRRRYTIMRDRPRIEVYVEVVPEGGYRPFRLRTGANLRFAGEVPSPTDVSSVYVSGGKEYSGLKHIIFAREGAKFPSGRPFFLGRYADQAFAFSGDGCKVKGVSDGAVFSCSASSADQIFGWRARKSASVEFIFPDAYDHYDPHAIKTWKATYAFEFEGDK